MERSKLRYDDALRVLETLREILEEPYSIIVGIKVSGLHS